jgi:hypothetical protein
MAELQLLNQHAGSCTFGLAVVFPFLFAITARARGWLQRRHQQAEATYQALRLAARVTVLAAAIDAELGSLRGHVRFHAYQERCARLRQRADAALAHGDWVRALSLRRLRRAVSRLQADLNKLKQCRLDVCADVARSKYSRRDSERMFAIAALAA